MTVIIVVMVVIIIATVTVMNAIIRAVCATQRLISLTTLIIASLFPDITMAIIVIYWD